MLAASTAVDLAQQFGITVDELLGLNGLDDVPAKPVRKNLEPVADAPPVNTSPLDQLKNEIRALLKRNDWQHEDAGFYPRATLGELLMRARGIIEADVGPQPPVGKRKGGEAKVDPALILALPDRGVSKVNATQQEQADLTGAIVARCGLAAAALGWLWISDPAAAIELTSAQEALYTTVSILPPSASSMTVCYGFVCRRREILDFTPADRAALRRILGTGRSSSAAERAAVQKAVIWFDRRMGPIIGTDKRVGRANIRALDDKHNFDCWDTTRNTTSLLLVLQEWGLLKHHLVGDPHYRGIVLTLQFPHNTAVLVDRATKTEWVVDMWTRGYAEAPDVKPLAEWIKED